MLIDFTLLPIAKIQPWGQPGDLSLHWFGLTDGYYWIEVGENKLFEYSEDAQAAGACRFCEYQVVRLHEDLLEMLPHILEPVPDTLAQYLSGNTAVEWRAAFAAWCDRDNDRLDMDRFDQVVDAATTWSGARRLDSAYLSPSADIVIWSDIESVYLEWDNRDRLFLGKPAWSALRGSYKIPRADFIAEVRSFNKRLMDQMSDRVHEVLAGALGPSINIDMPALVREHEQRSRALESALRHQQQTDWKCVGAAMDEVCTYEGRSTTLSTPASKKQAG
jgi:hypothetical protein